MHKIRFENAGAYNNTIMRYHGKASTGDVIVNGGLYVAESYQGSNYLSPIGAANYVTKGDLCFAETVVDDDGLATNEDYSVTAKSSTSPVRVFSIPKFEVLVLHNSMVTSKVVAGDTLVPDGDTKIFRKKTDSDTGYHTVLKVINPISGGEYYRVMRV